MERVAKPGSCIMAGTPSNESQVEVFARCGKLSLKGGTTRHSMENVSLGHQRKNDIFSLNCKLTRKFLTQLQIVQDDSENAVSKLSSPSKPFCLSILCFIKKKKKGERQGQDEARDK